MVEDELQRLSESRPSPSFISNSAQSDGQKMSVMKYGGVES